MVAWFSDHYSSGVNVSAMPGTPVRPSVGKAHARKRYDRIEITVPNTAAVNDTARLGTYRSGDRIHKITVHAGDGFTATADLDIGLAKKGDNHDGAVIDADLFGDALDIGGGLEDAEAFIQATTLVGEERGQPLWYLANIGAGTYTADPGEEWDLLGTFLVDMTTGGRLVVEVEYTSGD